MKRKKKITPYLLILPSMFFLVLFIYYPAVKTLFKSLFLINSGNMPVKYVGLGNYRKLFSDETFLKSIVVTFEYALVVIPVTILMGYLLALISASGRRLSPVYELMYAMPMAVSMSVASVRRKTYQAEGYYPEDMLCCRAYIGADTESLEKIRDAAALCKNPERCFSYAYF